MRTTLALDDDVLLAAKGLATLQRKSLGEVISDLARQGLQSDRLPVTATRNGVPLLPARADARTVTPELVSRLGEDLT